VCKADSRARSITRGFSESPSCEGESRGAVLKSPNTSVISKDWSRDVQKLLTLDQNQSTLTEFFPLQNSVDALFKESDSHKHL